MQTTDDILFSAHGPDPIPSATTEIVGTPGNSLNVYWIVSHFPIGSVVSGPFPQKDSPNVLDDENYVHISWLPTLGALSYDLLFTRRLELPKQPGNFALALDLTDTEFRDTGQSLSEYDLAGIRFGAPQQEWIFFDNRDRKQPTLRFIPWPIEVSSIIFEDGSSLSTAGAAGGAAPPNQSVQFNNNGAFGGSPNLIWDGERLDVNALVRVSNRFVSTSGFGVEIGYDTVTHWGGIENFNYDTYAYEPMYMNGSMVLLNHPVAGVVPGNVGIGTNNPQAQLEVAFATAVAGKIFQVSRTAGYGSLQISANYNGVDNPWLIQAEPGAGFPASSLCLNPVGGNVGIGTQNPQQALEVVPAVNVTGTGGELLRLWSAFGYSQISGGEFGGLHRLRIDADPLLLNLGAGSGNVGIGTQNPQATLDVNGDFRILGPTGGSTVFSVDSFDTLQVTNVGGVQASSFRTDLVQGGALVVQSTGTFLTISGLYTNLTAGNTLTLTGDTFLRLNSSNEVDIDASGACVIRGNATIQVRTPNLQFQDSSGGGLTIVTPTEFAIFVNIAAPNLPSSNPGGGTKQLWYDPTDGNIVKFAA